MAEGLATTVAHWTGDVALVGFLLVCEAVALVAAATEKALESHSRSGVLEAARERGLEKRGQRLLDRLPTYLLSARILRFLGKAALVVGIAAWLLGDALRQGTSGGAGLLGVVAWGRLAAVLGLAFAVNFVLNDVLIGVFARRGTETFLLAWFPLLEVQRLLSAPLRAPLTFLVRTTLGVQLEAESQGAREEVRESVVEGQREGALSPVEAQMIGSIMDLQSRKVADVLVPRARVSMLQADTRVSDALIFVREDGHSRVPVYGRDKDDVLGMLYARDLLALAGTTQATELSVRELMRPAYFVPETKRLPELLSEMKRRQNHLAVVVTELRGTAGVISIEDVLEQIVGPIQDEHDEETADAATARRPLSREALERGPLEVDARTHVDEANAALSLALPMEAEYDTLAGLLLHRLGKVPQPGERLSLDEVTLTVSEADERRVKRVRLDLVEHAPRPPAR